MNTKLLRNANSITISLFSCGICINAHVSHSTYWLKFNPLYKCIFHRHKTPHPIPVDQYTVKLVAVLINIYDVHTRRDRNY